jgi:hypothetical protein
MVHRARGRALNRQATIVLSLATATACPSGRPPVAASEPPSETPSALPTLDDLIRRSDEALAERGLAALLGADPEDDALFLERFAARMALEPVDHLFLPGATLTRHEASLVAFRPWTSITLGATTLRDETGACHDIDPWRTRELHFPELETLDAECAASLAQTGANVLDLHIPALAAEAAVALAAWRGRWGDQGLLFLSKLATIDEATARALASWVGLELDLSGLGALTLEAAGALAGFRGSTIRLQGLTALDEETAAALAVFSGGLDLGGLTALDPQVATRLGASQASWLSLHGVTTLEAELAERFVGWGGVSLNLTGLTALDADAAQHVAAWKVDELDFGGVAALDVPTAGHLASWAGSDLRLGATALDPATATALAGWGGKTLRFTQLAALDALTASALSAWGGETLRLDAVAALDADTAAALAAWGGDTLDLRGVSAIDVDATAALARWQGRDLVLDGIESLDGQTAAALAARSLSGPTRKTLSLRGLSAVEPSAAETLVALGVSSISLDSLTTAAAVTSPSLFRLRRRWIVDGPLDLALANAVVEGVQGNSPRPASHSLGLYGASDVTVEAAAVLATLGSSQLNLGTRALSPAAAEALAAWTGRTLRLPQLTSLDPASAAALARWPGDTLQLDGLRTLDAETATALIAWGGQSLTLEGLTALPPDAACVLAGWGGKLRVYVPMDQLCPAVSEPATTDVPSRPP